MVEDNKSAGATEAATQEASEAPEAKKHDVEYADEEAKGAVSKYESYKLNIKQMEDGLDF